MKLNYRPLEKRTYRYKNPAMEFFCPLCSTKRAITTNPHLSIKNYIQIGMLTIVTSMALWPLMSGRSLFSFFFYWAGFEGVRRLLFRKEIPCPHCGFDASWYKRDVKMAKQLVHNFWDAKTPESEESDSEAISQNLS